MIKGLYNCIKTRFKQYKGISFIIRLILLLELLVAISSDNHTAYRIHIPLFIVLQSLEIFVTYLVFSCTTIVYVINFNPLFTTIDIFYE